MVLQNDNNNKFMYFPLRQSVRGHYWCVRHSLRAAVLCSFSVADFRRLKCCWQDDLSSVYHQVWPRRKTISFWILYTYMYIHILLNITNIYAIFKIFIRYLQIFRKIYNIYRNFLIIFSFVIFRLGMTTAVLGMYLAEIAPSELRGTLAVFSGLGMWIA